MLAANTVLQVPSSSPIPRISLPGSAAIRALREASPRYTDESARLVGHHKESFHRHAPDRLARFLPNKPPPMSSAPRPFSTSARVHPSILPYLHTTTPRRSPMRWAPTIVGLSIVGYGAKIYIDSVREKRERILEARYQEDRERQRRNDMLMDVYGDRESLEGLEKAIQFYENGKK